MLLHINCSLFEQLCTICCACVVHEVKNCAKMHNSTTNLHSTNESMLRLALCRFVVYSCSWVLCIACNCCALCICTNTHLKFPIRDNISNWGLGIYESGNESENKSPIPNWLKYPIGYFLLGLLLCQVMFCYADFACATRNTGSWGEVLGPKKKMIYCNEVVSQTHKQPWLISLLHFTVHSTILDSTTVTVLTVQDLWL